METTAAHIPAIQTEGLTKRFGEVLALDGLSLEVRPGEIFGFLGPNGAGKTTAIRILLDFIRPAAGRARILGHDCRDVEAVHRRIGYLPGELSLYPNYTAERLFRIMAGLRRDQVSFEYVGRLCERLKVQRDIPVGQLSHGSRQKVGLVIALMPRPDLLILDEPTSGLDPLIQVEVLDLLREVRAEGRTVFFSSHNLPEVERICDRVAIIRQGRLVELDSIEAVKARQTRRVHLTFAGPVPPERFAALEGVRVDEALDGNRQLRVVVAGDMDALVKTAAGFHCVSLVSEQPSLEEEFLSLYGKGGAAS